jgi:hypothetical protein
VLSCCWRGNRRGRIAKASSFTSDRDCGGVCDGSDRAKYGNVPAVAAFDSGNLLAVATALRDRFPDKRIMIAGDDDHKLENNPGRVKALEAALAAHGMVVFPN